MRHFLRAHWIEGALVLAIIATLAMPVLRVIYGSRIREWERQTLEILGLRPELVWVACAALSIGLLVLRFRSDSSTRR